MQSGCLRAAGQYAADFAGRAVSEAPEAAILRGAREFPPGDPGQGFAMVRPSALCFAMSEASRPEVRISAAKAVR